MRLLIQRVSRAGVFIRGHLHASIGKGLLVLAAITHTDTEEEAALMAKKLVELRIFEDEAGKMNLSVQDIKGELLVISQFTLYANCRRGRRPDFMQAALPEQANHLYEFLLSELEKTALTVKSGIFAAYMQVELINDGPVTILLDSENLSG